MSRSAPANSRWIAQLPAYARLTRMHRPIGIGLLLWPVLWALWIAANGIPDLHVLLVFVLGTVSMRAAGCVINDIADRNFDAHVRRTAERPLATGEVTLKEALGVFVFFVFLSAALVLTMNRLTILLSLAGIVFAVVYPFMKRYTYLPQVFLGAAFGWGIPMAFAAQTNALPPLAWLVFATTVMWALIYDTEYAMVDREDDLKIGIKSTAILFDDADRLFVGVFQVTMLSGLWLIGREAQLGSYYATAVTCGAGLFIYQQYLIRHRSPADCFKAFMNNNWFGLVIFAGIVADLRAMT